MAFSSFMNHYGYLSIHFTAILSHLSLTFLSLLVHALVTRSLLLIFCQHFICQCHIFHSVIKFGLFVNEFYLLLGVFVISHLLSNISNTYFHHLFTFWSTVNHLFTLFKYFSYVKGLLVIC